MQKQGTPQRAATPAVPPTPVPVNAGEYVLRDKLVFAGFATPEAAMQSASWAMASGSYEATTNALSPKMHEEAQKKPNSRATTEASLTNLSPRFQGMQILARKDISDQQVEIKAKWDFGVPAGLTIPDGRKALSQSFVQPMVKVGDEWKIGDSSHRYTPEWDKSGTIQNFVP